MVAAHIYREDSPRVTVSHNRLGLSLSKYIRHRLVAKIKGKRRLWAYEALDQISVDYSHARCAPVSIASPHHAPPSEASEHTCVCVSPFLLSSTHLQVHREQPTL
jgi:hypothetical protein